MFWDTRRTAPPRASPESSVASPPCSRSSPWEASSAESGAVLLALPWAAPPVFTPAALPRRPAHQICAWTLSSPRPAPLSLPENRSSIFPRAPTRKFWRLFCRPADAPQRRNGAADASYPLPAAVAAEPAPHPSSSRVPPASQPVLASLPSPAHTLAHIPFDRSVHPVASSPRR